MVECLKRIDIAQWVALPTGIESARDVFVAVDSVFDAIVERLDFAIVARAGGVERFHLLQVDECSVIAR